MVSVDVKHHVYLLTGVGTPCVVITVRAWTTGHNLSWEAFYCRARFGANVLVTIIIIVRNYRAYDVSGTGRDGTGPMSEWLSSRVDPFMNHGLKKY